MAPHAENPLAYVLSHIGSSMTILDVGCGSGKLTCDIARNVQQGSVVGLDNNTESLSKVREYAAAEGITNVNFIEGDILSLNYPDDAFDIVHARHVLHYVDALSALKEMRRVTKLGGIVAVREGARTIRWPIVKELEEFDEITRNILKGRGGNIETGAMFRGLAYEAEFEEKDVSIKASTRCLASNSQLGSYCSTYSQNMLEPDYKKEAMKFASVSEHDIERISDAWKEFGSNQGSWIAIMFFEMIAIKSE